MGIKDNDAAMAIPETARGWAADIIVLGSYGNSAAARLVPVNVEYDLLANRPCKILVVGNTKGCSIHSHGYHLCSQENAATESGTNGDTARLFGHHPLRGSIVQI